MSAEPTPLDPKVGNSRGRALMWRLGSFAVLGGIAFAVVGLIQGEELIASNAFYARAGIGPLDRILIVAWFIGLLSIAMSTWFAARGRFPRTDAYYSAQLGFGLCVLSGIGFLFRIYAMSLRYG